MALSLPSLGKRIRELRLAQGVSMRELAARAKLKSPAFISDLERGFRNPSPRVLDRLAAALETPLSQLQIYDPRPPLDEIRALSEQNPEWTPALRHLLDAAAEGLTPTELIRLLQSHSPKTAIQPDLLGLPERKARKSKIE